jgi:glycosyltransferase involved in cell wall biosynthesis
MKKIGLLLETEPRFGGVFQHSQAMLDALSSLHGDQYSIVVAYTLRRWSEYLSVKGPKTVYIPKGFAERTLWRLWGGLNLPVALWRKMSPYFHSFARALLREQCDLWIFPAQSFMSSQIPVPALSTIHDLMHRYEKRFTEVSASGEYRLREWTFQNMCRWSLGILVDSEVGKSQVMESYNVPGHKIHVLPYVPPKYIYSERTSNGFESRYPLPSKFLFYPAQFWEHKNHKMLIRAMGRLKNECPDLKLVLSGSGKNGYQSTARLIKDLRLSKDIIIFSYIPDEDMAEMYRRARALVMPTFFGPTNIPPLEAFAAGCPVAISRIYGIPEQVGEAALLFNPESEDEIARCIRRLWNDDELCRELSRRGRQRAEKWNERHFRGRLKEIINHVLENTS